MPPAAGGADYPRQVELDALTYFTVSQHLRLRRSAETIRKFPQRFTSSLACGMDPGVLTGSG